MVRGRKGGCGKVVRIIIGVVWTRLILKQHCYYLSEGVFLFKIIKILWDLNTKTWTTHCILQTTLQTKLQAPHCFMHAVGTCNPSRNMSCGYKLFGRQQHVGTLKVKCAWQGFIPQNCKLNLKCNQSKDYWTKAWWWQGERVDVWIINKPHVAQADLPTALLFTKWVSLPLNPKLDGVGPINNRPSTD